LAGDYVLDSDSDGYCDLRELISGSDRWSAAEIPSIIADAEPLPSGDGDADGKDLADFIAEIGVVSCSPCRYDLDTDGDVDEVDAFLFAEDFGRTN
jgi:hypothetical protein